MKKESYNFGKNDEYYTPKIIVEPLKPHFERWLEKFKAANNRNPVVLCPFDTANSEFVLFFQQYNDIEMKHGHIKTGQDFFSYDYGDYDIVISNPPFSVKKELLLKLYELNKPFALLMNLQIINYQNIASVFVNNPVQMLAFDKKISYTGGRVPFSSGYFCHNFLSKDLIFESLPYSNANKGKFIQSRMYKDLPFIGKESKKNCA